MCFRATRWFLCQLLKVQPKRRLFDGHVRWRIAEVFSEYPREMERTSEAQAVGHLGNVFSAAAEHVFRPGHA